MPMCHANSLNFFGAFGYCGGVNSIYSRKSFDPEHAVKTLAEGGSTFTSLVPTHYIMMLGLPQAVRGKYNYDAVTKLMISSAPARPETKREVMEMFPNSGLFELYGATETGWVTMLHPHEQFTKLGSVGRECVGAAPIKILDEAGNEVPDGEAGELYSCNAHTFDCYWRLPEKTKEAFRGDYCSVGDMARRDEDGYIHLSDRKSNMIISGGENIYPSEVEALVGAHPLVKDVAVIGLPDAKWGERVHAVIVLHDGATLKEADLQEWSKERLAGYKRPRSYAFIAESEMPRNATGKVLHRELKKKYSTEHVAQSNRSVPESRPHASRPEFRIADLRADPHRIHLRLFRRVRSHCDRQSQPLRGLSGAALADVRGDVQDHAGPGAPVRLRRRLLRRLRR